MNHVAGEIHNVMYWPSALSWWQCYWGSLREESFLIPFQAATTQRGYAEEGWYDYYGQWSQEEWDAWSSRSTPREYHVRSPPLPKTRRRWQRGFQTMPEGILCCKWSQELMRFIASKWMPDATWKWWPALVRLEPLVHGKWFAGNLHCHVSLLHGTFTYAQGPTRKG